MHTTQTDAREPRTYTSTPRRTKAAAGLLRRHWPLAAALSFAAAIVAVAVTGAATIARAADVPAAPTFAKDVAPILYSNCVVCHRPGEVAPMSLITYQNVRPWARAIKNKVVAREMPPWSASPASISGV